jgi:hypothetical protein
MSDDQTNLNLRQRRRLQESAADGVAADGPATPEVNHRRRWAILVGALMILLAGGAAWAWIHFHPGVDPRLQEIYALQGDIAKLNNPMKDGGPLFRQMHDKVEALPDDLKAEVRRKGPQMFRGRMQKFFAMSHEDQLAELDKIIAGIQLMEAARKAGQMFGGPPPANSGAANSTAQSGNASPPPHGPWGSASDSQRVQHLQSMLSDIPPEDRAQFNLFRQMLTARMQQQNIQPPGGGFF